MQVASRVLPGVLPSMQTPLQAGSLCMELAAAHMTLLRIAEEATQQLHRQTGAPQICLPAPLSLLP